MRNGRNAEEFAQSPQQQSMDQEALISRLQLKASRGDTDALATLRMLDSMHGQNRGGRQMGTSESPSVDQKVRSDARDLSPGENFYTPSATLQMLAHLASQGDEETLSTIEMLEALRVAKTSTSPVSRKPAPSAPAEPREAPVAKRIDTVKVVVKPIQ